MKNEKCRLSWASFILHFSLTAEAAVPASEATAEPVDIRPVYW
jgi:hypothetical protein